MVDVTRGVVVKPEMRRVVGWEGQKRETDRAVLALEQFGLEGLEVSERAGDMPGLGQVEVQEKCV